MTIDELKNNNKKEYELFIKQNKIFALFAVVLIIFIELILYFSGYSLMEIVIATILCLVMESLLGIFLWYLWKIRKSEYQENIKYPKITGNTVFKKEDGIIRLKRGNWIVNENSIVEYGNKAEKIEKTKTEKFLLVYPSSNKNIFIRTTGEIKIYYNPEFSDENLEEVKLIG